MNEADKLALLRDMVGQNNDEEWSNHVLKSYLKIAGQKIINRAYPYDDSKVTVPAKYEILQCRIAAYLLNKRGAEGETSHSENGISRSYEDADIPESLMSEIIPYVGVI